MYDVYRGAFVTIAASATTDNTKRIFAQRYPLLHLSYPLDPTFRLRNRDLPVYFAQDYSSKELPMARWPLNKRGWMVKETLHPLVRAVHFLAVLKSLGL
jgi:hypothetical protein